MIHQNYLLSILFMLIATIGLYTGYQRNTVTPPGNTLSLQEKVEQSDTIFSLRDTEGNILMEGGIESASANIITDALGNTSYVVEIRFTDAATETFSEITEDHIGEQIGIYLDEDMLASPLISYKITDGVCRISNLTTYEDAVDLAEKLSIP